MTYVSDDQRQLDVVLQQAQMVAFALPVVGAGLAAGLSILGAVFDAYAGGEEPRDTYSAEQAINDLGKEIVKLLGTADDTNLNLIARLQMHRSQTDGDARNWTAEGSKADGPTAITNLLGNPDVVALVTNLHDDPAAIDRLGTMTFDPAITDCCTAFPALPTDPVTTVDDVKFAATFAQGHTTLHAVYISTLKYVAVTLGLKGKNDWMTIRGKARTDLEQYLAMAVDHLCKIVVKLEDAVANADSRARAAADAAFNKLPNGVKPGPDWLLPYTHEYRKIRNAAFLDHTTPETITSLRGFIESFYYTLANLNDPSNAPSIDPADPTGQVGGQNQGGQKHGGPTPIKGPLAPLGPRQPKTARFLYETASNGDWVKVLDNTTLGPGLLVSQNAGSAKTGIYYMVDDGGTGNIGGLNQIFEGLVAGQSPPVNQTIAGAYDAKWGSGSYATDSAANPTRQDRLTSFLVPLSVVPGSIGDNVLGMMYSAAPDLSATGLTDPKTYGDVYSDALAEIAAWNSKHPKAPIVYFRVTMLSTSINAGAFAGAALNQSVAEIIIQRVVDALAADAALATPVLQNLVILINNSDKRGSVERTAFDAAAAKVKGVVRAKDGFDVTITGSGATPAQAAPGQQAPPPQQTPPDEATPYWRDPTRPPPFVDDRPGFGLGGGRRRET